MHSEDCFNARDYHGPDYCKLVLFLDDSARKPKAFRPCRGLRVSLTEEARIKSFEAYRYLLGLRAFLTRHAFAYT